ncbi:NTP transferase domain-containing protein [Rhodococcus sp. H36-A4]|uniref:NTP transferase domain-containing protein n=1 Tax=Rhodococcus sp. H36-A4 TaxID=3004353 RepID=UPI0022AE7FF8|nr:NTP transferase domain-containing protein [Rhodococcus sp. H36-A4]MCZ4078332.1 NTP transferase domain-containing protein [Rhodococcus sp. H36-A4]
MSSENPTFDAIVLAGGRGSRMGGVDKPALTVGRRSMIGIAVEAVRRAGLIVTVGPTRHELNSRVLQTQESPAGSGPVAAVAAGLRALRESVADVVVILAADLPLVDANSVDSLLAASLSSSAGATFVRDETGRTQYLFGVWDRSKLVATLARVDALANRSMRSIVPDDYAVLDLSEVSGDCDTVEDLHRARARRAAADCIPPALTIHQARKRIRERLAPVAPRGVPPLEAHGTVLAEPMIATRPLPYVDISAMDGYAVSGDGPWTVRGDIAYAGTSGLAEVAQGHAVRIATGAHVPAGATSVVRDEFVELDSSGKLRLSPNVTQQDDTRRRGEDWHAGAELAPVGTSVSPAVMSVALSAEVAELTVRGPVRAQIVLSGNEIRAIGPLEAGQTRDALGPILPLYLHACGITVVDTVYLPDSPTAFEDLLTTSTAADLTIVVGATGGGAADQLRTALVHADAETVIGRILVRPGGSQITAVLPSGRVVLGLPGNPLAAIGTLLLVAPTVVEALTDSTSSAPRVGNLTNPEAVCSPTARIVPVMRDGTGWRADTAVRTAHLLHLIDHEALAVVPAEVSSTEPVELLPIVR